MAKAISQPKIPGPGLYYIINDGHQKYLDTHGKHVQVWSDGPLTNTGSSPENIQWELVKVAGASDLYYMINKAHQKYLDTHGKDVQVWSDGPLTNTGSAPENIQWQLVKVAGSSDLYYVINKAHQKYLDTHGKDVQVWSDGPLTNKGNSPKNIQWKLVAAPSKGTQQIVVVVRHAKSKANEYTDALNPGWTKEQWEKGIDPETAQKLGLFNSPLSIAGMQAVEKHRNDLWRHIHWLAGGRNIRVFCSPIKRALQTCLISLDCKGAAPLFAEKGKVKVSPVAMLMERGNCLSNEGIPEEAIKKDVDFDKELHGRHIGKEIMDFSHFLDGQVLKPPEPDWWRLEYRNNTDARVEEFMKLLNYRENGWDKKPPQGEVVVVFSHHGFTHKVTGQELVNFGTDCTDDDKMLSTKAIIEKLGPKEDWTWWRKPGEYESKLAPLP